MLCAKFLTDFPKLSPFWIELNQRLTCNTGQYWCSNIEHWFTLMPLMHFSTLMPQRSIVYPINDHKLIWNYHRVCKTDRRRPFYAPWYIAKYFVI